MKNKKIDPNKLLLGAKKTVLKSPADEKIKVSVDDAITRIHAENKKFLKEVKEYKETKRTTIDIPTSLHKRINQRILDKDIPSMKDYFLGLAIIDLGIE